MFSEPFLLVAFASLSIVFALVYRKQRRIISHVRGPSNPSLLLGWYKYRTQVSLYYPSANLAMQVLNISGPIKRKSEFLSPK